MTPEMEGVLAALRGCRFNFTSERELQDGVAQMLDELGVEYEREREFGPDDRIDFWFPDGMGIEVKIQESLTEVTRQLHRYAGCDEVRVLVLLTTKMAHRRMPEEMCGKPIHVLYRSPF
jgi:hypothetical protein